MGGGWMDGWMVGCGVVCTVVCMYLLRLGSHIQVVLVSCGTNPGHETSDVGFRTGLLVAVSVVNSTSACSIAGSRGLAVGRIIFYFFYYYTCKGSCECERANKQTDKTRFG